MTPPPSREPEMPNEPVTRERLVEAFGEEAVAEMDRYFVVPGPNAPSREPGQAGVTDADEPERWPQECESVTTSWRMSRLLRDRTRYREHIVALEKLAQDVADSGYGDAVMGMRDEARALLEVQDEDHN